MRFPSLLLAACLALSGCRGRQSNMRPAVEITRVPPADKGGPDTLDVIEGRVVGAQPGQQVVLFSKSRVWWIQPEARRPFTEIQPDSTWRSSTHLGTEYAALLVDPGYRPPVSTEVLPTEGGGIVAVAVRPGDSSRRAVHNTRQFGGYEWIVRAVNLAPLDLIHAATRLTQMEQYWNEFLPYRERMV